MKYAPCADQTNKTEVDSRVENNRVFVQRHRQIDRDYVYNYNILLFMFCATYIVTVIIYKIRR